MKTHYFKNLSRSLFIYNKPKTFNSKIAIIFLGSFLMFNIGSSFQSPSIFDTSNYKSTMRAHFGHLKLSMSSNSLSFNTDIYFNSNATQGLDPGYDSALSGNPPAFSIYSHLVQNNSGIAFSIQSLSDTDLNNVTVSLGLNASQGQNITISIAESDISESIDIYLEDTSNNSFTLLNTADYTFTSDTDLTGTGRFYLIFDNNLLSTTEESLEGLDIYSDKNTNTISVNGLIQNETNFKLYDISGRLVTNTTLDRTSTTQTINTSNLTTGIYIVSLVNNSNQKRIQKLIIE